MKYIATEGMDEKSLIKAGKARLDAVEIANKLGYKTIMIPSENGVREKKWQKPVQFYIYSNNSKKWDKALSALKDDDTIIIQYPLLYTSLNFRDIIKKHSKRVNIIALIHDLDSIRFKDDKTKSTAFIKRVNEDDFKVLNEAKMIIAHNEKMSKALVSLGIDKKKLINLEIFDYIDKDNLRANIIPNNNVIIAGNLGLEKSRYLADLKKVKNVNFNLYGIYFDKSCESENVHYKGVFKPDELIKNLHGSWGLIWDGNSIETCNGLYGNYLRYNNPHKTSLYLSAGLPIIIWKKAALADFIEKNKVGITINKLEDITEKLKNISEKEYNEMVKNAEKIAKKLKDGYFLTEALKKAEK